VQVLELLDCFREGSVCGSGTSNERSGGARQVAGSHEGQSTVDLSQIFISLTFVAVHVVDARDLVVEVIVVIFQLRKDGPTLCCDAPSAGFAMPAGWYKDKVAEPQNAHNGGTFLLCFSFGVGSDERFEEKTGSFPERVARCAWDFPIPLSTAGKLPRGRDVP